MQNKSRDDSNLEKKLLTVIVKFSQLKIPIFAVWYSGNEKIEYGTKHLKSLLGDVDKDNAIKADIFNMTAQHPDGKIIDSRPDRSATLNQYIELVN